MICKAFVKRISFDFRTDLQELGYVILERYSNLPVDVHHPAIKKTMEIRETSACQYKRELQGVGGMPFGMNGKALLLISGGMDRPLEGSMLEKSGVTLCFFIIILISMRAQGINW